jgi:hypothetical protein
MPTHDRQPARHRRLGLLPRRAVRYPLVIAVVAAAALGGTGITLAKVGSGPSPAVAPLSLDRDGDRVTRDLARTDPSSASPSPSASAIASASATPSASASPSRAAAPATTRAVTRSPTPKLATPAGCAQYSGNQMIACQLLPSFGFSTSEMSALVPMWSRESGWSASAENPSSGAYGIPQALPGDKMASVASDWRTNPATQIKWGLDYIKSRYGTPSAAWSFWQANGWY